MMILIQVIDTIISHDIIINHDKKYHIMMILMGDLTQDFF